MCQSFRYLEERKSPGRYALMAAKGAGQETDASSSVPSQPTLFLGVITEMLWLPRPCCSFSKAANPVKFIAIMLIFGISLLNIQQTPTVITLQ